MIRALLSGVGDVSAVVTWRFKVYVNAYRRAQCESEIAQVRSNVNTALAYAEELHFKRARLAVEAITLNTARP